MNKAYFGILLAAALICANCGSSSKLPTPTAAFKAYYEASQKGDAAAIKQTLSNRSLDMLNRMAGSDQAVDAYLLKTKIDPALPLPEIRNETINGANGDHASIEVKAPKTGKWDKWQFVKEGGGWKVAFENMFEEPSKD